MGRRRRSLLGGREGKKSTPSELAEGATHPSVADGPDEDEVETETIGGDLSDFLEADPDEETVVRAISDLHGTEPPVEPRPQTTPPPVPRAAPKIDVLTLGTVGMAGAAPVAILLVVVVGYLLWMTQRTPPPVDPSLPARLAIPAPKAPAPAAPPPVAEPTDAPPAAPPRRAKRAKPDAPSKPSTVRIETTRKAVLTIDGTDAGPAPLVVKLPAGPHTIEAMVPGRKKTRQRRTLTVDGKGADIPMIIEF